MASTLAGIYRITNSMTGEFYIGQAIDLIDRRGGHFYALEKGTHANHKLQADYSAFGAAVFSWKCELLCDVDDLDKEEKRLIDTLSPGYNIAPGRIRKTPRPNPIIQEMMRQLRQARKKRSTHK